MSSNARDYTAPAADLLFAMTEVAGLDRVRALPGCAETNEELVRQILDEAGRFGADVLAPLNRVGDIQGARLENGIVRTPEGFADAYAGFIKGGWNAVPSAAEFGGQDLPWLVATAVSEIWNSANMAFALCPLLTQSAVDVLTAHGTPELKALFLPRLVSGEWTGTMVLTEPQAGSDLARIRTRAVPDGTAWRVTGQKIFITWGDHDVAENIVHMVLARTPGAPEGIKGLSLFAVPKFVPEPNGRPGADAPNIQDPAANAAPSLSFGRPAPPGARNDLRALSLEHKLGIHASPTAVMAFGENGGARGFLVGEENRGIEHMFIMMNNARLAIGLQGVACAERAYQRARAYARERVQSRAAGSADHAAQPIERHPDVKRMLLFMKSRAEVGRLLALFAAAHIDQAKRHPDPTVRACHLATVELLTPVVKGWCTDAGIAAADVGIQVHGGMGYIEETGAAQNLRDARITAIYEGTNGIQALDLVGRKVGRDQGRAAFAFIGELAELRARLAPRAGAADFGAIAAHFEAALAALESATRWIAATWPSDPVLVAAGATAYLRLFGIVAGGGLAIRAALAAQTRLEAGGDRHYTENFLKGKIMCARFFAEQDMVSAPSLARIVMEGGPTIALANESAI